jgi:hypothetical protein
VYQVTSSGPELRDVQDALDLISIASEYEADWIAIPIGRLGDDFFDLRTRIASDIVQKLGIYNKKVAIIGDISARVAQSNSLAAFVAESNGGRSIWFLPTVLELERR